jgi:hypothetical protein
VPLRTNFQPHPIRPEERGFATKLSHEKDPAATHSCQSVVTAALQEEEREEEQKTRTGTTTTMTTRVVAAVIVWLLMRTPFEALWVLSRSNLIKKILKIKNKKNAQCCKIIYLSLVQTRYFFPKIKPQVTSPYIATLSSPITSSRTVKNPRLFAPFLLL